MERKQTHFIYGFIIGLIMVVINAVMVVTKINLDPALASIGYLGFAIFLAGIIMNANAFSKANHADVTFGQVFGSGFKATAIVTIIVTLWAVASTYIFPSMIPDMLEMAHDKMVKQGKLSDEQIEMAMNFTRKSFKTFMISGTMIMSLILGAIFSLIAAAVAKKNPQPISQG